jgi:hypothetical protein
MGERSEGGGGSQRRPRAEGPESNEGSEAKEKNK